MAKRNEDAQVSGDAVSNAVNVVVAVMSLVSAYWALVAAVLTVAAVVVPLLFPKDAPVVPVRKESVDEVPCVPKPCVVLV